MDATTSQSVIDVLRDRLERLPSALARIAHYVLENPEKTIRHSVQELGEFSGSGEASVLRLCRQIGFEGFREFKLALTAELARASGFHQHRDVPGDVAIQRLHGSMAHALETTYGRVAVSAYEAAAADIARARRIDIYGAGVSGMIGEMLAYRLLRLGLAAQAFRDANLAHEVTSGLNADCVVVAVSESGVTSQTVSFVKLAKTQGAPAVALTTRPNSPVARRSDHVLLTASVIAPMTGGLISAVIGMTLATEILALEIQRFRGALAADRGVRRERT
jgi:DNA-binding MurR/RpiR family transcriptional regulator